MGDGLFARALEIDRRYADMELGPVDSTSLARCERHHIHRVFAFDRKHFGAYRPGFAESLELLP